MQRYFNDYSHYDGFIFNIKTCKRAKSNVTVEKQSDEVKYTEK